MIIIIINDHSHQVVKLPKGEDFNDWLAVHVVDFFNRINLIYGTVCEQVWQQKIF